MVQRIDDLRKRMMDITNAKDFVLSTSNEIMAAAQDVLKFCRAYAETTAAPAYRTKIVDVFSRAIAAADQLSRGLTQRHRPKLTIKTVRRASATSKRQRITTATARRAKPLRHTKRKTRAKAAAKRGMSRSATRRRSARA